MGKQSKAGCVASEMGSLISDSADTCVVLSPTGFPQTGLSQNPAFGSWEPEHESEWSREGDAMYLCVTLSADGRDRGVSLYLPSKRNNSMM